MFYPADENNNHGVFASGQRERLQQTSRDEYKISRRAQLKIRETENTQA
jgi:hypothetical protein